MYPGSPPPRAPRAATSAAAATGPTRAPRSPGAPGARFASASRWASLGVVDDQAVDVAVAEPPAALEEAQLDEERAAGHDRAGLLHESAERLCRASGRDQVVVDQYAGAAAEGVPGAPERVDPVPETAPR